MHGVVPARPPRGLEDPDPWRPPAAADLFAPLDRLLWSGGDQRVQVDPATGANPYGCRPAPDPDMLWFASSTATSVSARACDRLIAARDALMRRMIAVGLERAAEDRIEEMRDELKTWLRLPAGDVEVVFSPSGTDAQLHALFLGRALLGPALTTIIVGADQTGSGTVDTARGRHFGATTAAGLAVRKGEPVAGLAGIGTHAIPLMDETGRLRPPREVDAQVLEAVEAAVRRGGNVLLQIMDASKLGWRAPGDACVEAAAARWPGKVQVVVDACQMRLGRARLARALARGHLVIVTGSKYFTGPPFGGAVLVPARVTKALGSEELPDGCGQYMSRCDWPPRCGAPRARLPARVNLGQWIRWEAALEEMRAYYSVPGAFRYAALADLARAVEALIAASPSLCALPRPHHPSAEDDEEFAHATIFPFLIRRDGEFLAPPECALVHRALAADLGDRAAASDAELAARRCQIGQPVAVAAPGGGATAALRICADARLVSEASSPDAGVAQRNLARARAGVATVIGKLEWLLADPVRLARTEHGHAG